MAVNCVTCAMKELPPKEAELLPVMLLYASPKRFPGAPPARSVCGIPVCQQHKAEITLDYLLTDEGFATICGMFALIGKAQPERSATKLIFIDIKSDEARSFLSSRGARH